MLFKKVSSPEPVAAYLASVIGQQLRSGSRVLWLIPGGSAIQVAVDTAQILKETDCTALTITLTDERYGPVGHADSNWLQLQQQGFVLPTARLLPVLNDAGFTKTTGLFSEMLQLEFKKADYKIGFFGIGPDGHTAGILPRSSAVTSKQWADGYDANFVRITMTSLPIRRLDEAVVYAVGKNKWPVIDSLSTKLPSAEQPAQFLKSAPKLTIFNDHKGEVI